jgi:hypothetical protein
MLTDSLSVFGVQLFPRHIFTLAAYHWAVHVVESRSLWWLDEPHIVPLFDTMLSAWSIGPTHSLSSPSHNPSITASSDVSCAPSF